MSRGGLPTRTPQTTQVIACPPRRQAKPADPCAMVIFGAGGDLTKRLVVPALYNLSRTKVKGHFFYPNVYFSGSDGVARLTWAVPQCLIETRAAQQYLGHH